MAVKDRAAAAAIDVYSEIHQSLLKDAQEAEVEGRPLTARTLRFKASRVARAALMEDLNPQPIGLAKSPQQLDHENREGQWP